MFEKYHIYPSRNTTTYVDRNITVNEHRAPTDESLNLLREMEEKCKSSILYRELIQDNILNGVIIIFHQGAMMDEYGVRMRFTLNGHEYNISETFNRHDVRSEIWDIERKGFVGRDALGKYPMDIAIRKMFYEKASETLMKEFMTRCQIEGL